METQYLDPAFRFQNRTEAGKLLARRLLKYVDHPEVVVLGLPRGGVPVAYEVAETLHAPLDVLVVRKLGTPGQEELAMGAIASGGIRVLYDEVVSTMAIPAEVIDRVAAREQVELERREKAYRDHRPAPEIEGRTVIIVDDGLATGTTMRAAIAALKRQHPARIVMAIPTAPVVTAREFATQVDEMICLMTPESFYAVGQWYDDFTQTSDTDVRDLLARAYASRQVVSIS